MANDSNKGAVMIALRFFPTGGRDFGPCDLFPHKDLDFTDRRLMQMEGSRHIAPLTRDAYQRALTSREAGYIGKGFTQDGLIAMGIIDAPADDEATPAKTPAQAADGADWKPDGKAYKLTELYEGFWIAGNKRGVATRFDIFDAKGAQLNGAATLNGLANAKTFVDNVIATREANASGDDEADEVLFADFPDALAEWSEEQHAQFDAWFDGLVDQKGVAEATLKPAAIERYQRLRLEHETDEELVTRLSEAGISLDGDESHDDLVELASMLPGEPETTAVAYPATVTPKDGKVVVTFRDVPEAEAEGADLDEALANARTALSAALAAYADKGLAPTPSGAVVGEVLVSATDSANAGEDQQEQNDGGDIRRSTDDSQG